MENSSRFIQWKIYPISLSKKVFWIFNFLLCLLLIYFFFLREYFLILLIVLIIFALSVIYFHSNEILNVFLDQEKIVLNQDIFHLSDFESFVIFKSSKNDFYLKLYPKSRFRFPREILLPKDETRVDQIRDLLKQTLKEKKNVSESIFDEILRSIGL
ncbi:hypothetical protein J7J41_01715 [bacterium]|nr:hypothetical protein [bacterium]